MSTNKFGRPYGTYTVKSLINIQAGESDGHLLEATVNEQNRMFCSSRRQL